MNNPGFLPFADSYWVIPGKFMAGEYPGGYGAENTRKRMAALIQCGVNSIIDLTQPGDSAYSYASILLEEAAYYSRVIIHRKFPISDFGTPAQGQMEEILNIIDGEIALGHLVYVHCLVGIGRTGTVVGCYLVRHGARGEEALEQLNQLRSGTSTWWQRSPESQEQVDYILNWRTGNARPGIKREAKTIDHNPAIG